MGLNYDIHHKEVAGNCEGGGFIGLLNLGVFDLSSTVGQAPVRMKAGVVSPEFQCSNGTN